VVPANVAGRWTVELSGNGLSEKLSLNFEQKFQKIEGVAIWALCSRVARAAPERVPDQFRLCRQRACAATSNGG